MLFKLTLLTGEVKCNVIFNLCPAVPKCTERWDVSVVLKHLIRQSVSDTASHLNHLVMIMAKMIKASRANLLHTD